MTDTTATVDPAETDATAPTADAEALSDVDTPTDAETETAPQSKSLNDFWTAVDSVDQSNPNFEASIAEYEKFDRSGKMKITAAVKRKVFDALDADNLTLGKFYSTLTKAIAASTGATVDADPTEELVHRMAGIYLGYKALSDANPGLAERVKAEVAKSTEDKTTIAASLAQRLVETKMGRKPREGGGTRHNVGKHIAEVFADKSDGTTLTVKQLAEAKSEEYGDDAASVVSIQAHLKNSFSQPGLSVVKDGDKIVGVRKGDAPEA